MNEMFDLRTFRKGWAMSIVAASVLQGGYVHAMEHRIAGKTAQEVFKGPHLAELASAACEGDAHGISKAIAAGADPNGLSVDGGTPLLWAVYCNSPKGVEFLLRAGANPNYKVTGKYSATYAAATAKDPQVLRALLAHGGDPNADAGDGWSALRYALGLGVEKNRWENYYALINAGADIRRLDSDRMTIPAHAAALGQFDKVAELLDRGYDRDLTYIGRLVQVSVVGPSDPQARWKAEVMEKLKQKGVQFPVPPLQRGMN